MSATEDLLQDHVLIRRLQSVIEKSYTMLYQGRDVPFGDLLKIADIIEQFVDQFHHGKEETGYFAEAEHRDHYSDEIRKFVVEHEFGRRIAKRVRIHLEELLQGKNAREPLARYLKTYAVFILDHTSKEDRLFTEIKEKRSLSDEESLRKQFDHMRRDRMRRTGDLVQVLEQLEKAEWAA